MGNVSYSYNKNVGSFVFAIAFVFDFIDLEDLGP